MHAALSILLCAVIAASTIAFGHVFKWENTPLGRKLNPIECYVYGTVCIVFAPVLIFAASETLPGMAAAAILLASVAAAGGTTMGFYAYDAYTATHHHNMDLQDKLNYAQTRNAANQDVGD